MESPPRLKKLSSGPTRSKLSVCAHCPQSSCSSVTLTAERSLPPAPKSGRSPVFVLTWLPSGAGSHRRGSSATACCGSWDKHSHHAYKSAKISAAFVRSSAVSRYSSLTWAPPPSAGSISMRTAKSYLAPPFSGASTLSVRSEIRSSAGSCVCRTNSTRGWGDSPASGHAARHSECSLLQPIPACVRCSRTPSAKMGNCWPNARSVFGEKLSTAVSTKHPTVFWNSSRSRLNQGTATVSGETPVATDR